MTQTGQTISDLFCVSQCQGNPFQVSLEEDCHSYTLARINRHIRHRIHPLHDRTRTAMGLVLVDKILLNNVKGKLNKTVLLDLSKDFNTVPKPLMKLNGLTHAV